jgi:putative DNA primase/helicase
MVLPHHGPPINPPSARVNQLKIDCHYIRSPADGKRASASQVLDEFRAAMVAAGIIPPADITADSKLHRFHVEDHRHGSANGAYILHIDQHPAGYFENWKTGIRGTWKLGGGKWRMDEATRKQIEADRKQRQAEIEARHMKRAAEARVLWGKACRCTVHDYLIHKGVKAHELRFGDWPKWIKGPDGCWRRIVISGALLIPMYDENRVLWNLQAIFAETIPELGRDKDFMGGRKAGLFFTIGEPSETLLIAEGYATAATVHESTGHRVYVAFDRTNLKAVALTVRKLHPKARIIIAADNDRFTPGNPGLTDARAAALAVDGLVSMPEFPEVVDGTDWNDWAGWRRGERHV